MEDEEGVPPCPRCNGPFVVDHCIWCGCRACVGCMSCGGCVCQAYDMHCDDCGRRRRRDRGCEGGDSEEEGEGEESEEDEGEESEEESEGGDIEVPA